MLIWPDEIANNIVIVFQVTSPRVHATIVYFTLLAWFASWIAACAAIAGAAWVIYRGIRRALRWVADGVDEALADEGRA